MENIIGRINRDADNLHACEVVYFTFLVTFGENAWDVKAQYTIKYALIAKYAHTDTHRHKVNIVQQL